VEHFHPHLFPSRLRAELVRPEPELVDGRMPLPAAPGLGVELVEEVVEGYRVA
jgi:L-alanine-DL-glutamate epimerase-like enolase superfamily enzyme